MDTCQFQAIIAVMFLLHLIQVGMLAEMLRRLTRMEKALASDEENKS